MLIAVNITMFCTSDRLHKHLSGGLFTELDTGLEGIDGFMHDVVDQINTTVLQKYIALETK